MKAVSLSIGPESAPTTFGAEEPVVLRSQDARGVVTLTMNRPQAFNALSEAMLSALQREFDAIADDESVRVVVVAAEGKAFCAGTISKKCARSHRSITTSGFSRNALR